MQSQTHTDRSDEYESVSSTIGVKALAREILKVLDKHKRPKERDRIARRWPFELLQNAHDAGAKAERSTVCLKFNERPDAFEFEHDGRPFEMEELASLIHGSSSKEFDGEGVGRFGSGFLASHILSRKVDVQGLLRGRDEGYDRFSVELDRPPDDESRIEENIKDCKSAFRRLGAVEDPIDVPTAKCVYHNPDSESLQKGLERFEKAVPYLYGTCPQLGEVHLDTGTVQQKWCRRGGEEYEFGDAYINDFRLEESRSDTQYRILRIRENADSQSSLLVLLQKAEGRWQVHIPDSGFSRIFVQEPLTDTGFIPLNCIIESQELDTNEDRDELTMAEQQDYEMLENALDVLPIAVQLAQEQGWEGGHKLARVEPMPRTFSEKPEGEQWWKHKLNSIAERLAKLPLVETSRGSLPATSPDSEPQAGFLYPRPSMQRKNIDGIDDLLFTLAKELSDFELPHPAVVSDWAEIADGWSDLGIQLQRAGVAEVLKSAKAGAQDIDDLRVATEETEEKMEWCARALETVAAVEEAFPKYELAPLLERLTPDMKGGLQSPRELCRGPGIPEELKDIAEALNWDVRSKLVEPGLTERINDLELQGAEALLSQETKGQLKKKDVIDTCLKIINKKLSSGEKLASVDDGVAYRDASIRLLRFLWKDQRKEAKSLAQKCPVVAQDGTIVRVWQGGYRWMIAPVEYWSKQAQPFSEAYPEDLILSDCYASNGEEGLIEELDTWNLILTDPKCTITYSPLEGKKLKSAAHPDSSIEDDATVPKASFTEIALLDEVLERCGKHREWAKALFGLVLNYMVHVDEKWNEYQTVSAETGDEETTVEVRNSLWVSELANRRWVPIEEDGDLIPKKATAPKLEERRLIHSEWLRENEAGQSFLTEVFSFDEQKLFFLANPDSDERKQVLQMAHEFIQEGVEKQELQDWYEDKKAENEKDRLGSDIEEAVAQYLMDRGPEVECVDKGYDYCLTLGNGEAFLLEVKATTSNIAKLTPAQAETAVDRKGKFVLCVVDLRDTPRDRLSQPWSAEDIAGIATVIPSIHACLEGPVTAVQMFDDFEVDMVFDEGDLRYGVPSEIWENGIGIEDWANEIAD